jgi:hypothetical protein
MLRLQIAFSHRRTWSCDGEQWGKTNGLIFRLSYIADSEGCVIAYRGYQRFVQQFENYALNSTRIAELSCFWCWILISRFLWTLNLCFMALWRCARKRGPYWSIQAISLPDWVYLCKITPLGINTSFNKSNHVSLGLSARQIPTKNPLVSFPIPNWSGNDNTYVHLRCKLLWTRSAFDATLLPRLQSTCKVGKSCSFVKPSDHLVTLPL